jgi:Tfp pilus assembly protein PilF
MPEANLKKAISQRINFLEPLSRAYLSAVEAGGPWAIAALDRLALFATKFAEDVDAINPPAQADSAAIARFRKALGSVSVPLRRKAVDTWMNAYQQALAGEVLSPALPEIADRLADAHVPSPARAQGFRGRFRLAGVPADGGEVGRVAALSQVREKLGRNPQDSAAWADYGNLLWGEGKPLLARIAYERALSLNSRNAAALNNRGVVLISSEGEEDWQGALEGMILFRDALKQDEFFLASKMNRAAVFNYYRLFDKAKQSWDQVLVKYDEPDVRDGLGVSLAGMGQWDAAQAAFRKAGDGGAQASRFVVAYHEAAHAAAQGGAEGAERCLSRLSDLEVSSLPGFERSSAEHLKRTCTIIKSEANSK